MVQPADIGGEEAFRRHQFQPRAGLGDELGGLQARMGAVVVIEQDLAAGLLFPAKSRNAEESIRS